MNAVCCWIALRIAQLHVGYIRISKSTLIEDSAQVFFALVEKTRVISLVRTESIGGLLEHLNDVLSFDAFVASGNRFRDEQHATGIVLLWRHFVFTGINGPDSLGEMELLQETEGKVAEATGSFASTENLCTLLIFDDVKMIPGPSKSSVEHHSLVYS